LPFRTVFGAYLRAFFVGAMCVHDGIMVGLWWIFFLFSLSFSLIALSKYKCYLIYFFIFNLILILFIAISLNFFNWFFSSNLPLVWFFFLIIWFHLIFISNLVLIFFNLFFNHFLIEFCFQFHPSLFDFKLFLYQIIF